MNKNEIIKYIKRWFKEKGKINIIHKYNIDEGVECKLSVTDPFIDWRYIICINRQTINDGHRIDMNNIFPSLYADEYYRLKPKLYILFYNFLKKNRSYAPFIQNLKTKYLIDAYLDDSSNIRTVRDYVFKFNGSPTELVRGSFNWALSPCGTTTMWQVLHIEWFKLIRKIVINGTS